MTDTFIVTITPPTPNGDLHIGHIAGPFLAADIFTRTQRLKGAQCYLVSYSDDYQSYLVRKALESGTDAASLAKVNSAKIQASLRMVDIQVDHWLESHENSHFKDATQMLYEFAQSSQLIETQTCLEPYCEHCAVWGYEAFARGGCDHCGHSSDPSQCEFCAMAPDAREMVDLACILCSRPVVFKSAQRRMLKLPLVAQALRERLESSPMRPQLRAWIKDAYGRGLSDWGVTRPGEAGLKLYDDEAHRVHTWFMGQAGYFAALKELSLRGEDSRDAYELLYEENTRLVNFLGMDCSYSHVLAYPAQVLLNPRFRFKSAFYTNAFLKLDGEDFSTSRGHAIWVRDLVSDACADSVRFYVSLIAPEQQTENFEVQAFWGWRQRIFGELLPKMLSVLSSESGASEEHPAIVLSEFEVSLIEQWQHSARHDEFSMKGMAQVLMSILEAIAVQLDSPQVPRSLITLFALLGAPTLPATSQALQQRLSLAECASFRSLLGLHDTSKEGALE